MSEAGEPQDARDWFGGARPAEADRAPTPVAEAFGHLPKESADGASDWFGAADAAAGANDAPDRSGTAAERAPANAAPNAPAAEQPPVAPAALVAGEADAPGRSGAGAERVPAAPAASAFADLTAAPSAPEPDPAPENDPRVRLRALTGGLADLSDAMAAIGIESVAVRSTPARPAASAPAPAPAADFRVRCPDCGPQYVAIADVRFVETGDGADANRYLFTCPACGARVRRPAGPELAEILKSSGVATLALRRGPGQAL